jgi:broad specificity phosphatase PhoE
MIRSWANVSLHLVRHAEAYKNLDNIHGGGDQRLTERGTEQAISIGQYLLTRGSFLPESLTIIHQPEGRTEATAQLIGATTMSLAVCDPQTKGVGMGIVAGLSEEELAEKHPDVAEGLANWRNSGGALKRPNVPGSEPMVDFAERISKSLKHNIDNAIEGQEITFVVTTSSLVMLKHLLTNDGTFSRSGYEFFESPLGSVNSWLISDAPPIETVPIIIPT